jgi:hypothetical protein
MKRVFCLLLIFIMFLGCDEDDKVTNPENNSSIWPLKIGNQWTYEWLESDSLGTVLGVDTIVLEVAKDTLIQSETWYIITEDGARTDRSSPTTSRQNGIWIWETSAVFFAKYPAAVNDTFICGTDTVTVESVNDTVITPAGTFICYRYRYHEISGDRPYQDRCFAPGVGFIEGDEYYKTGSDLIYQKYRGRLISKVIL